MSGETLSVLFMRWKMDKTKFVGIKVKDGVYISDNVLKQNEYYFTTKIKEYRFDQQYGDSTYVKDWVFINHIPSDVEIHRSANRINVRYELKEGFSESEAIPKIINKSYIDEDSEFYGVSGLYEQKFEIEPETFIPIEFEINIIDSLDDFKPIVTQYEIESSLLDKIMFHPVLLPTRPCRLNVDQSYKIIREHVKQNIDKEFAKITSDYDFCFQVDKNIILDEPEEYQVDVNNLFNYNKRKRKEKLETRYRKIRNVKLFEMAPKPYQKYTVIKPFEGTSYENMMVNIQKYLDNLIEQINKPLIDCPNCKGMGVITK
jgi:hypothetical protein